MFNKVLLTGAWGFIGSTLADKIYDSKIAKKYVFLDAGFTGANRKWMDRFQDDPNVSILKLDLAKESTYNQLKMQGHNDIDGILHLAAQSHVDRSINDAVPFAISNVIGSVRLLEFARELPIKIFLNFCTDEVMGSRIELEGPFQPHHRKMPRNPYSASKSSQEDFGFAYSITHGVPVVTTRCTNIYGPRQFPEKFLPVIITKLINNEKIPVYGQGLNEREWINVDDACSAVLKLLDFYCGEKSGDLMFDPKDAYFHIHHIAGEKTYPNIEFLKKVIDIYESIIGDSHPENYKYEQYFEFVEDRKGHDFRYDLDASSMTCLGWAPETSLEEGLKSTIEWYLDFFEKNPGGWN